MPRSKDRMSLEFPRYLYESLGQQADRRGMTTAGLAAEIIGKELQGKMTPEQEKAAWAILGEKIYLTEQEAADLLDVAVERIGNHVNNGVLPIKRIAADLWRIPKAAVVGRLALPYEER